MNYGPSYDNCSDDELAEELPRDFGYDNPEVIRLIEIRDAADQEVKADEKKFYEFDILRCEIISKQDGIHWQISTIDQQRPQLLADIFMGDGDFTKDDEAQQCRANLVKENERFKLAYTVMLTTRQKIVDQSTVIKKRYSKACRDVDDLIRKLRVDHMTALRG
ncbi:MAG: hypothetical protein ABTQ26_11845 [Azonexus sp.]